MSEETPAKTDEKPKKPRIVVVGSMNVDHTLRVAKIPESGETVTADGLLTCFGGKGANQALAAVRAGAKVELIGMVGVDDVGVAYRGYLAREGVNVAGLGKVVEKPTGSAFIAVDAKGDNIIVVNPGANYVFGPDVIEEKASTIKNATVLLMQLECPLETVKAAAELGRESGAQIIINPSPWNPEFLKQQVPCDILIVNAGEEEEMGGADKLLKSAYAKKAGLKMIVVTNGAAGTKVYEGKSKPLSVVPPKVKPVDTVGAGDAFAGAFAVALTEGMKLREAIQFANAAGALTTQKNGSQAAIPGRLEIEDQLEL